MLLNSTVVFIFFGVLMVGFAVFAMNVFNSFVRLRNELERAWSNIDVILKQRFDEIPQLIQVIEQYVGYESDVIKSLVAARSHYGSAGNVGEKIKASQEMNQALQGVIAIGEGYPELKANENFMQLQSRISSLESTISDRRELYNEAVANFNTRIDQVPDMFVARMLNYQRREMFNASDSERAAPSVKINVPKFGKSA